MVMNYDYMTQPDALSFFLFFFASFKFSMFCDLEHLYATYILWLQQQERAKGREYWQGECLLIVKIGKLTDPCPYRKLFQPQNKPTRTTHLASCLM